MFTKWSQQYSKSETKRGEQSGPVPGASVSGASWALPLTAWLPPARCPVLPQVPSSPPTHSPWGHVRPLPSSPPQPCPSSSALTLQGHDVHPGPLATQPAKPLPGSRVPEVGEAGGEDAQCHVPVLLQELGHPLCTAGAGAPGYEPGDTLLLMRGQHLILEPRKEAEFCMAGSVGIDLGEMGGEGAPWVAGQVTAAGGCGQESQGHGIHGSLLSLSPSLPSLSCHPFPRSCSHPRVPTHTLPSFTPQRSE